MFVDRKVRPRVEQGYVRKGRDPGSKLNEIRAGKVHGLPAVRDRSKESLGILAEYPPEIGIENRTKLGFRLLYPNNRVRYVAVGAGFPGSYSVCSSKELFDQEGFDRFRGNGSRGRATPGGSRTCLTAVVGPRFTVTSLPRRIAEGVATGSAAKNAGKEPGRSPARCDPSYLPDVSCVEERFVDDRFVPIDVNDATPGVNLSEVSPVPNEIADSLDGPSSVGGVREEVRYRTPAFPRRSKTENLPDQLGIRARAKATVDLFVTHRDRSPDEDPPIDGVLPGGIPRLGLTVNLELGYGGKDRRDHPPRIPGGIESLGDGVKGRVVFVENPEQLPEVRYGSPEPIEFRDYDAARLARFDSGHRGIESGAMTGLSRLVKILENFPEFPSIKLGPPLDRSALLYRRDKRLALPTRNPGNPYITVDWKHPYPEKYPIWVAPRNGNALVSPAVTRRTRGILIFTACEWADERCETCRCSEDRVRVGVA